VTRAVPTDVLEPLPEPVLDNIERPPVRPESGGKSAARQHAGMAFASRRA